MQKFLLVQYVVHRPKLVRMKASIYQALYWLPYPIHHLLQCPDTSLKPYNVLGPLYTSLSYPHRKLSSWGEILTGRKSIFEEILAMGLKR